MCARHWVQGVLLISQAGGCKQCLAPSSPLIHPFTSLESADDLHGPYAIYHRHSHPLRLKN